MCIVLSHCAHVVREDFQYILTQCRMLLSFTFSPHPHPGFEINDGPSPGQELSVSAAFNPSWVLDVAPDGAGSLLARLLDSRLTTLSLDITTDGDNFVHLAQIISSAPRLTSLHLGPITLKFGTTLSAGWSTLPNLSFPELTTLSVHCDFLPFVQYAATQWTMPRLASLYCREDIPLPLLAAHGRRLTYLHFVYSEWIPQFRSANVALLPRLHELCPVLSHLVIRLSPAEYTALNLVSPSLRYLDIAAFPSVAAYRAIALAPTAHVPRLRKVRMVVTAPTCDFFPLHFHPARLPGSDRALEDLSGIPGADESDEVADWLMYTTGGVEGWTPEGLVRQHSWAVVFDERCEGSLPPNGVEDARIPDDDKTDSEGVYEYESRPTSPVDSKSDMDDEDDDGAERRDNKCEIGDTGSEDGVGSDSDMEREWFEVEPEMPPYPNKVQFVDDPLDTSRGQYDRETILERFSQSQLGDFLLE
ncbi:hypothetical protein GSI_07800 [Ganoderma sinense ZZ0214-1]|uniref:Uncharacterized protein n=1 Tax=Ganoderma sinense ZZ0214-1 TaxID=1077348 RepID=A0A2G8S8W6_9APHY|nr:hypothetical protein GSI_07633 [Ganoderma sinense ZZ0214-1]PIL30222.1 hypothetical protein GSI_07800 [Ganoderma sinense ZZ0214-1]